MEERNEVQTTQVREVIVEKNGKGKFTGYVAIVIAVIALVLSLANMGIRNEVNSVKQQITTTKNTLLRKEQALENALVKTQIMAALDRVYALSMVERNYEEAKKEFAKAKSLYTKIKPNLSAETASRMDSFFASLKKELDKGPSPIPGIISNIRELLSTTTYTSIQKAPVVEKKAEKATVIEEKAEVKAEVKKEESPVEERKASTPKKLYNFWKSIGEKLAK